VNSEQELIQVNGKRTFVHQTATHGELQAAGRNTVNELEKLVRIVLDQHGFTRGRR
jgi:hypothetical protein